MDEATNCKIKPTTGFASPAQDYLEKELDLNQLLITKASSTFFMRASNQAMKDIGIFENDLLIVDRSRKASAGSIVVALFESEFIIRRFQKMGNRVLLVPENKSFKPIEICAESDFEIWGVVTYVIHKTE